MIEQLFPGPEIVDRFTTDPANAVDVIIPIIHTNGLWETNLKSIFREIPVKRLLISDGGCIDNSLVTAKKFPRVQVFDHKSFTSLGYCIRSLIEKVETEHFVYLHSDVLLTPGWFDRMLEHRDKYDWYESSQTTFFLVGVPIDYQKYHRPLSGGQLGRRKAFDSVLPLIEDDYLYRNEDLVLAELVRRSGGTYGRAENALLYHQVMNKESKWKRTITQFQFSVEKSREEEIREANTQARGLVKYVPPENNNFLYGVIYSLRTLVALKQTTRGEFMDWVGTTPYGAEWQKVLGRAYSYPRRIAREIRELFRMAVAAWKNSFRAQVLAIWNAVLGR